MPSTIVPRDYNLYIKRLTRNHVSFTCRHCNDSILPKDYERHCSDQHDFDSKLACVWCKERSWKKGQKNRQGSHLMTCYENFFKSNLRPPVLPNSDLTLLNLEHSYLEKTLYDSQILPVPDHDFLWPLESEPPPIPFPDDNLNLASSYLIRYFCTADTHDWLHVMVKAVAFEAFVRALDEDQGTTRTLLFSCWCNGGPYEEARHRQHLHLIVVAPKEHFVASVWPKVQVAREDRPGRNFPCKGMERILSPMHLVNTLGYLSHRKSQCKFTTRQCKTTPSHMHHFYLYRTLPLQYRLPLTLLWDGGLQKLLHQEKFLNVSVKQLAESPLTRVGSQWRQKIKHFYGHERGIVLPVSKPYMPCEEPTPYFFHLLGDRKLYFRPDPENEALDLETWMRRQARGGNCFYDNVEEDTWSMRPCVQAILTDFMPVMDRNEELEAEVVDLKRKYEESEARCREKQAKIDELREKLMRNEQEIIRLNHLK